MKRYGMLVLAVLGAALIVSLIARLPRRGPSPEAPAAIPVVELAIEADGAGVTPAAAAVPKDHRVLLTIHNTGDQPLSIRLAGYERQVTVAGLPPDSTWRGEFLADLPGEDFAWIVGERPAGRLSVTGSHLVEGHR